MVNIQELVKIKRSTPIDNDSRSIVIPNYSYNIKVPTYKRTYYIRKMHVFMNLLTGNPIKIFHIQAYVYTLTDNGTID